MRALLALTLLTSVAHAGSNEVSFGSEVRALRSRSANAMTDDSYSGGRFAYARAVDISPVPALAVWLTGSISGGGATGTMFQTMATDLEATTYAVGGRAQYQLQSWLDATGGLELGPMRAAVELTDTAGHSAADHAWGMSTRATVGVEALGHLRRRYSVGLRLELGYVKTSKVALTATPASSDDGTLQLPMQAAPLGTLDLSGPTFQATMTVQF